MADRGLCSVCAKAVTLTKEGTPYKHDLDGDTCPGYEREVSMLESEAVWLVYGGERDGIYAAAAFGPVKDSADHPQEFDGLPLLGTTTSGDRAALNAVLPAEGQLPEPPRDQEVTTGGEPGERPSD